MEKTPTKVTLKGAQGMGRGAGMRIAMQDLRLPGGRLHFGAQAADHTAKSDVALPMAQMQRRSCVRNLVGEIGVHPLNEAVQNSEWSKLVDEDMDVGEASMKLSSVQLSDSIYEGKKVFDDFM
uniref:Uncharacterized protein n=1 Tax=Parascaris univalens TaxID=6257 RepID=A0A915A2P6_PARUN